MEFEIQKSSKNSPMFERYQEVVQDEEEDSEGLENSMELSAWRGFSAKRLRERGTGCCNCGNCEESGVVKSVLFGVVPYSGLYFI